jgi:DNA polymerase III subunit epsilon
MAGLPSAARAHRALADAEMAAHLTLYLERIQNVPKSRLQKCVERYGQHCD